jgi:hypothetical protein
VQAGGDDETDIFQFPSHLFIFKKKEIEEKKKSTTYARILIPSGEVSIVLLRHWKLQTLLLCAIMVVLWFPILFRTISISRIKKRIEKSHGTWVSSK